jgi:hypothetical protein
MYFGLAAYQNLQMQNRKVLLIIFINRYILHFAFDFADKERSGCFQFIYLFNHYLLLLLLSLSLSSSSSASLIAFLTSTHSISKFFILTSALLL